MRRPHVADTEIRALIRELTVSDALPPGAVLRRSLQARYGRRGGVTRIYRLLAEERARGIRVPEPATVEALQQEVRAMRERAERSEMREQAHQSHWGMEIDRLRLRLQTLEPLAARRLEHDPAVLLRQQLRTAEQRVAQLEQQLLELLASSPPLL